METTAENTNEFFQCVDVHGVPVNVSGKEQALREVETIIKSGKGGYVCFFEGKMLRLALKDASVRKVLNEASLVYPDGIVVSSFASLFLNRHVTRVSGPSFMLDACRYGVERKWKHFFYGGAEGVAEKMAKKLQEQFPGLQVAGCYCPPFRQLTDAEEAGVRKMIEESGADLLWVGLGGPKQEYWMNAHLNSIHVPVMLGVGAAFDFHSGNKPWAPAFFRKHGIEWIFRLSTDFRYMFFKVIGALGQIVPVYTADFFRYRLHLKKYQSLRPRENHKAS